MEVDPPSIYSSKRTFCLICSKEILISYDAHPELHSACLSRWDKLSESEKEAARTRAVTSSGGKPSKQHLKTSASKIEPSENTFSWSASSGKRNLCQLCQKEIFIPFDSHPTLHTTCHAKWERGERPAASPQPQTSKPKTPASASTAGFSFHQNLFGNRRSDQPSPFQTFRIPIQPTQVPQANISDPVERILVASNYYQIFDSTKSASDDMLKLKFKQLAISVHPDRNKSPGSTEAFKKVVQAWECLSDPVRRKKYDESGYDDQAPDQQAQYILVERWRLELLVELLNSLSTMVMGTLPYK